MKRIIVAAGMAFGDEGKGTMVDYWSQQDRISLLVRYGGPQAAHNVVLPNGVHHTFSQFGSATFSGVPTYLSEKMLVDPLRLLSEADVLSQKGVKDCMYRLIIDPQCLIVTPFHAIINRMREMARGGQVHGTCGLGVGEAVRDGELYGELALRAADLCDRLRFRRKLDFLWRMKVDAAEQILAENPLTPDLEAEVDRLCQPTYVSTLAEAYRVFYLHSGVRIKGGVLEKVKADDVLIFEGSQGVLLDRVYGFAPYVAKTSAGFESADFLWEKYLPEAQIKRVGILRAYQTRHGAGPFPSEDARLGAELPDEHNLYNRWQGGFRVGHFDALMARYALSVAKPDVIVLTNLDRLRGREKIKICTSYEYRGQDAGDLSHFFVWKKTKAGRLIILGLKHDPQPSERLAQMLFDCQPYEQIELEGWSEDISSARTIDDLPPRARDYVECLASPALLGHKIQGLSLGPSAKNKLNLMPLLS
jgi:adenylosuccinate synthase